MRLLHTSEYRLETFVGNTVPEYAILSHVWDKGEVLFRDFEQGVERTREGWAKLDRACKLAANHGYEWVWIDTCCIDKSSSAELQESINSMYNWYAHANVCYAYLKDVPQQSDPTHSSKFEKSVWFTRGWTLRKTRPLHHGHYRIAPLIFVEELIAPSRVEFYSECWGKVGTREDRRAEIARITGIREEILEYEQFDDDLVFEKPMSNAAEIFSWAAHRKTTVAEDKAYALLGLLDINMPMLYGEGANKAFLRLQDQILQRYGDQTLLLWRWNTTRSILASDPSGFCSRDRCSECKFLYQTTRTVHFDRYDVHNSTRYSISIQYFELGNTYLPDGNDNSPIQPPTLTSRGLQINTRLLSHKKYTEIVGIEYDGHNDTTYVVLDVDDGESAYCISVMKSIPEYFSPSYEAGSSEVNIVLIPWRDRLDLPRQTVFLGYHESISNSLRFNMPRLW